MNSFFIGLLTLLISGFVAGIFSKKFKTVVLTLLVAIGSVFAGIPACKVLFGAPCGQNDRNVLLCGRHKRDRYGRIPVHACGQRSLVWRRVLRRAELGGGRRSARFCDDPKARLFPHSGPCDEV